MIKDGYLSTVGRQKPATLLGRGYSTEKKYQGLTNYTSANSYLTSLQNPRQSPSAPQTTYSNYLSHNTRSEDRKKADIHKAIDYLSNFNVGKSGTSSAAPLDAAPQRTYIQLRNNGASQEYPSRDPLLDLKLRGTLYDTVTSTKSRVVERPEAAFQSLQSFSSPEKKKTDSRTYFEFESATPAVPFEDLAKQNELLRALLQRLQKAEQPFTKTDYSNLKREVFYGAVIEKETLPKDKKDELACKELTLEQLRKELSFLDKYQAELEQTRSRYRELADRSGKLAGTSLSALRSCVERLESSSATRE